MSIDTIKNLNTQKRKLTLIFTLFISILILFLEIFFLGFKYIDYRNQEFRRLGAQIDIMSNDPGFREIITNIATNKLVPGITLRGFPFPPMVRRGRNQNMVAYDLSNNKVLLSSINDDTFLQEFMNKIKTNISQNKSNIVEYNGFEFLYDNRVLSNNILLLTFTQSQITRSDALDELLEYLAFVIIFSLIFYFVVYRFVSYALAPVEENIKDMEQFIYNAGHELKTPLSVVKSSLQLAKAKNDYSEAVEDSVSEINKMDTLISSLISLSTIKDDVEKSIINVNGVTKEITKEYENKLFQSGISLEISEISNLQINANLEYFKIVIRNILSNAIKYNKINGSISIIIDKGSIVISDTGVGIKKENINKVFERFYQENNVRTQDGFGIGLSLVKKISDLYKWKIEIDSIENNGTSVKIIF